MEQYKIKIEEEKKLLEEELASLGKKDIETGDWEATSPDEIKSQDVEDEGDIADRSEDFEERSIKLSILESRLNDLNHALSLIENGNYGICEICGKKIEEERLNANTSARTCEDCINKAI